MKVVNNLGSMKLYEYILETLYESFHEILIHFEYVISKSSDAPAQQSLCCLFTQNVWIKNALNYIQVLFL